MRARAAWMSARVTVGGGGAVAVMVGAVGGRPELNTIELNTGPLWPGGTVACVSPSAEPADRGSSPDDRRDLDPARIDHTCLGPDAVARDIAQLCAEARDLGFKTVCV